MRQHYYNDDGIMQYDHDRELLVELAKTVSLEQMATKEGRIQQRADLLNKAVEVQYEHSIHFALPTSIGGSLTYDQWKEKTEDDPTQEAFKRILLDAVERDFMSEEFQLMAWSAICELQMNGLFCDEDTD